MVCIYCRSKTKITNSRYQKKTNQTWRRHSCPKCKNVFTTIEAPQLDSLWMIRNRNNELSPFKRLKLLLSVYRSLKHRKTALDDANDLTATIIQHIKPEKNKAIVSVDEIYKATYSILKRFDKVSAVYYQAYHKA